MNQAQSTSVTDKDWWVQRDHVERDYPEMWRTIDSFNTSGEAESRAAWLRRAFDPSVNVRVIHVPRYGSVEAYRAAKLAEERAVAS